MSASLWRSWRAPGKKALSPFPPVEEGVKQEITPSQKLWAEVFGLVGIPELDEGKVLAVVDSLPGRQRLVVRLRFGFGGRPLSLEKIGKRLPRAGGSQGVSRETARLELKQALRTLRRPRYRRSLEDARKGCQW